MSLVTSPANSYVISPHSNTCALNHHHRGTLLQLLHGGRPFTATAVARSRDAPPWEVDLDVGRTWTYPPRNKRGFVECRGKQSSMGPSCSTSIIVSGCSFFPLQVPNEVSAWPFGELRNAGYVADALACQQSCQTSLTCQSYTWPLGMAHVSHGVFCHKRGVPAIE